MQPSYRSHSSQTTEIPRSRDRVHFNHNYYRRRIIMRYLLALIVAVFLSSTVEAQLSISLGFNVERQPVWGPTGYDLSLIHISEPTRLGMISYAVFCLKK